MTDRQLSIVNAGVFGDQLGARSERVSVEHVHRTELSSTVVALVQPGAGLRPHLHQHHDEIIVFLRGEATFRFADEIRQVGPGDVVSVPAGTPHATLEAKTECLLTAVFTPGFDVDNEDRVFVDE